MYLVNPVLDVDFFIGDQARHYQGCSKLGFVIRNGILSKLWMMVMHGSLFIF